jgi:S-adenosylmethionine-diacylgycerolhomoserine-N-methlytransferase
MLKRDDAASAAILMDRMYRHQRYFYDTTRKFYLLGRDRMIRDLNPAAHDRVLELGCGTGRNLILAAKRFPNAQFYGIDVSEAMLTTARQNIERAGLFSRIHVARADATQFDPVKVLGTGGFERVFISYSLSMIPAWRNVLRNAVTLLSPRGELHVVDFGDQRGLPRWFASVLLRWLAIFHVTPRDDLEIQLNALADYEAGELQFDRPFRGYAQYAVLRPVQA